MRPRLDGCWQLLRTHMWEVRRPHTGPPSDGPHATISLQPRAPARVLLRPELTAHAKTLLQVHTSHRHPAASSCHSFSCRHSLSCRRAVSCSCCATTDGGGGPTAAPAPAGRTSSSGCPS